MPVHKLPNGKYKWGESGKEYDDPKDAYAQGSAIEHSGWKEKSIKERDEKITKAMSFLEQALEIIKQLEVPNDSLNEDGDPLDPSLVPTSELEDVAEGSTVPVDVNLNNPQEPSNMLGGFDPVGDDSTDVTNVTDNPLI